MSGQEPRGGHRDNVRRNEQGRTRNRGQSGPRKYSAAAPGQRKRAADPARLVAFKTLREVSSADAYANLVLPKMIREYQLDRRDAGFATELAYGALRGQGFYDAILATLVDRPLAELDPAILDALRLGAHQLLAMRVPKHAALDETVSLARAQIGAGPSGLINAVLRRVSAQEAAAWTEQLGNAAASDSERLAIEHSHPDWIVRALRGALIAHGRDASELEALLEADNLAPVVNLVALPGLGDLSGALESGAERGTLLADSATYKHGDVSRVPGVKEGTVRVQDAGSQVMARALAAIELPEAGEDRYWLDMCAGPGGKAALLASIAVQRDARLTANEPAPHRARLVENSLDAVPHDYWMVTGEDGRIFGGEDYAGDYDRIMVDAPCSGLGALRRRPESRWRKAPRDIPELTKLQGELLDAAFNAVRVGGVIGFVTCSPHQAETRLVVEDFLKRHENAALLDTSAAVSAVMHQDAPPAGHALAEGSTVQLWPHVHGTDAMFMAILTKKA
ncbi:RsmB/NOP family class I SAM-dependent RNA methyltransferase [Glutamicibacter nicotianae]|uniref:RsmB/NOP family class I SAM-dependent RNA methyltransferase n=1 Tax=Glutamicibacter nicotianae TaxID=37929 RepID=UPI00255632AE|nr:transcription antitermination factor NusB [Glutamicibacter nicotianae]WIV42697.1 transcription antitermination factor NusB [Glutamicibacter nicotianae]